MHRWNVVLTGLQPDKNSLPLLSIYPSKLLEWWESETPEDIPILWPRHNCDGKNKVWLRMIIAKFN